MLDLLQDLQLPEDVPDLVALDALLLVHVLHGVHLLRVPLLHNAHLEGQKLNSSAPSALIEPGRVPSQQQGEAVNRHLLQTDRAQSQCTQTTLLASRWAGLWC